MDDFEGPAALLESDPHVVAMSHSQCEYENQNQIQC
jgi:hypothetical protein